jgi:superfamily II DNA/RNA helicase
VSRLHDIVVGSSHSFGNSLICSDLVSRGMDISHVSHVVNYDVPVDIRKYVHRVGRTARAGREGDAWSLVEEQEVSFCRYTNDEKLTPFCVLDAPLQGYDAGGESPQKD